MQINEWLVDKFGAKLKNNEANFPCPKCGHKSFYFNLLKKVGICFRAGCGWKPTLKELQEYIQAGNLQLQDIVNWNINKHKIIELPDNVPVISAISDQEIHYNDKQALEYLLSRNLSPLKIFLYKICATHNRVILPVYDNGVLVSYVARHFRGEPDGYRYLYPEGARHSQTLLNWAESRSWENITLIENSFVSIALRELNVSTNFGSHLSEEQIGKIMNSKIKSVVLMWDEGAEPKADKAVKLLRRIGMPACMVRIKGQPDRYDKSKIEKFIQAAHKQAFTNNYILDVRK